ncbi:M23 family metallopeptidase [Paramagnetospirillum marisnigri]|uniref:M23 family metallopeptidase n=1 Tax=Paramagnetospirillum marisnigri TaxID=1285242 RepID=UPI001FE0A826|nr:M23 family metallopeptidase [Paramagnetospirillum marisnigri]
MIPAAGKRAKALKRAVAWIIPEWQVFIRRPDGSAEQFTFTRKRQVMILAGMVVIMIWAAIVSTLLTRQPEELAVKERHLEEMMAATRAAQHRLVSSQKMVADIAREVDMVHTNILVLAETNAALAKDHQSTKSVVAAPRTRTRSEPAWNDDGQPASDEARAVRDQVRRLESSLERLKVAYAQAVQNTSDATSSKIFDAERALSKLGIDARQIFDRQQQREGGRGGPFIPLVTSTSDTGLSGLLDRLDRWSGVKAVMNKMPLGEPLHADYDINSGFGTRSDPLNRRTGVHEGVDLGAPHGTPVYATGEGVVDFAGPWDRYGLTIDINHGNGVSTRYAHLSRIKVKEGQKVTRSTVIGLLGNTGRSTGPHLHYEVRLSDTPKDPLKFIAAGENAPKAW